MPASGSGSLRLAPGRVVRVTIEKPVAGGRMLARHDGEVVLVSGAIPGEQVDARVDRVGRGVAYAAVERVLEPSPDRRDVVADWTCGGTVFAFIAYERQRAIKAQIVADAFSRIAAMELAAPPPVAASPERGYRMRVRLHLEDGRLGFYREGTHRICDVAQTGLLLADSQAAVERLGGQLRTMARRDVAWVDVAESCHGDQRVAHIVLRPVARADARGWSGLAGLSDFTGLTLGREGDTAAIVLDGTPTVSD